MPTSFTILADKQFVASRGWGDLTDADILAHAAALAGDARFHSSFAQLADFSGVTKVSVTSRGILLLAESNPFGDGARRAVVTSSTVAYGVARMYEIVCVNSGDELKVVTSLAEAKTWLGQRAPRDLEKLLPLKADWSTDGSQA
ncbi:hypothetical protein GC207_01515 [bacterium]|nr:hypothetical protein [bacterium]